ncbi:MAG: LysE family translocator [Pseudomonadota bacterium]
MADAETLLSFFLATALFAYVPGPGMLYTTAQTLARGRRAGLMAVLGLHLGGYLHVFAASAGLAVVLRTLPTAYLILKLLGAAYLIWLGISFWRRASDALALPDTAALETASQQSFWQSVVVEILNPKTALFFVAFLPQFADPSAALPLWAQLVVLGTLVNVMFSSADLLCVWLAQGLARRLPVAATAGWLKRGAGCVLILLGARLGTS